MSGEDSARAFRKGAQQRELQRRQLDLDVIDEHLVPVDVDDDRVESEWLRCRRKAGLGGAAAVSMMM